MTRITRERGALVHDDRLDALAMAVAYWTDRMSVDSDKQKAQWEEKERLKMIQKFLRGARQNARVSKPRWCLPGR